MSGLTNLKGFSLYADAMAAGYRPCKCCKPTPKHDIYISLPIYSKKRYGDGVHALIEGCVANSYEYSQEGARFTFETPVGIWRIDTARAPYRLQHINTAMSPNNRTEFHSQPRIFHSLTDAFSYIKRHDDHIMMQPTSDPA
jgi:methylphosphotriester-DNA--protein-cysteine methyltransferase